MKPLISGTEAKRFIEPATEICLLFPYRVAPGSAKLLTPSELATEFPKAWKYLLSFENELRGRESKKFDDDQWYRMGRTQNLEKQEVPKLLVAQLVPSLRVSFDDRGRFYINNVRVNGILPRGENGWYLLSILNAPVTNYIFKWLGKPKDNGYFEANKQFIAPLPIPKADRAGRAGLSALARGMQGRRTERVRLGADLEERVKAAARTTLPLETLLADVRPIARIEEAVPQSVPKPERKRWVDDERKADDEAALARIDGVIHPAAEATVTLERGKLAFLIDEIEVARLFLSDQQAPLVEAQWRAAALDFQPTGKDDAKRLVERLRRVALAADPALAAQIVQIGDDLARLGSVLADDEAQLHEMTCHLFNLSDAERRLVERGR